LVYQRCRRIEAGHEAVFARKHQPQVVHVGKLDGTVQGRIQLRLLPCAQRAVGNGADIHTRRLKQVVAVELAVAIDIAQHLVSAARAR
jgi:hypothetical protein